MDTNNAESSKFLLWAAWLIGGLLLVRFVSLGLYPLFDTTEARYAEIARIMNETENWITLQFDYHVPFWGKPPLHTWISALSFDMFGVSELTARLPHFICGLGVMWLVFKLAERELGRVRAVAALLVLSSSLGFIVMMGIVMPDTSLLLAITLAMSSFWFCFKGWDRAIHGHLFFAAMALGMLAKGPVALVLAAIPLGLWCLHQRCLGAALSCLPWLSGSILFLVLAMPWYLAAEMATPGFLNYFLVGEHIQRFLVSGWQGDLYGSAHREMRGMIWVFWLAAAFPWSLILIKMGFGKIMDRDKRREQPSAFSVYLFFWMIAPMLLFTLAGNILSSYVLPGFAAMAILVARHIRLNFRMHVLAGVSLLLLLSAMPLYVFDTTGKSTEETLLAGKVRLFEEVPLFYWKRRPFSAQFYSNGAAQFIKEKPELFRLLDQQKPFVIAMTHQEYEALKAILPPGSLQLSRSEERVLLKCF